MPESSFTGIIPTSWFVFTIQPLKDQALTKGEQSRTNILLAAKHLIAQRGFNAITLQDVLEAAQVTKGKFFHYFASKEELYSELLRFVLAERGAPRFEDLLANCSSSSPSDRLIFLLDSLIERHNKGLPDEMRLCIFATFFFAPDSPELQRVNETLTSNSNVLERLLRDAQRERELPAELNPAVWSLLPASSAVGGNLIGFLCGQPDLTSKALVELRKTILYYQNACRPAAAKKGSR